MLLIQVAAYVGASEIYLLGVDNTPGNIHRSKECYISEKSHFYEENAEDFKKIMKITALTADVDTRRKNCETAYKYAEDCSRSYGFRIYNATRGGVLEVFERVNFDSLFGQTTIRYEDSQ
jgi:hypothetical protein